MRCLRPVLHMLEHTSKSLRILEVCRLFCWECAADRSFFMALASSCSLPIDAPTCTTKHLSSDTLPIIKGRPLQNNVRNVTMMHHTTQAICPRLSSSAQNGASRGTLHLGRCRHESHWKHTLCRRSTVSLGPPILLTSARNRETSVCSLNTLAMSSLMTCRRKGTSHS